MVSCPGGPIVEIPGRGRYVFERLSPGTIRENDFYEEFRIIPGGHPGTKLLVACPRGATSRSGKCRVGQRALRIWHERSELPRLLKECKSGRLNKRRAAEIKRIEKDIEVMKKGGSFGSLSRLGAGVFARESQHMGVRLLQFVVNAAVGTVISVAVIKLLFPNVFSGEDKNAAAAAEGAQPTNQE